MTRQKIQVKLIKEKPVQCKTPFFISHFYDWVTGQNINKYIKKGTISDKIGKRKP